MIPFIARLANRSTPRLAPQIRHANTPALPLHDSASSYLGTNNTQLDALLHGKGWKVGSVTECLYRNTQGLEALYLVSTLQKISQQNKEILFINPPAMLIDHFAKRGIPRHLMRIVGGNYVHDPIWVLDMALGKSNFGAILCWFDIESRQKQLTRLTTMMKNTQGIAFCFHPKSFIQVTNQTGLRLNIKLTSNQELTLTHATAKRQQLKAITMNIIHHESKNKTYFSAPNTEHLKIPARHWTPSPWTHAVNTVQ